MGKRRTAEQVFARISNGEQLFNEGNTIAELTIDSSMVSFPSMTLGLIYQGQSAT